MKISTEDFNPSSNDHLLLAYVAHLELEVDRLRKQGQFLRQAAGEMVGCVDLACLSAESVENATSSLAEISQAAAHFAAVLHDLHDPPGYHPADDQVMSIEVRPLVEQVFRWQQRLLGVPHAIMRIDLNTELIEWFPARLRHILDNLISNALKYSDPEKGEARVTLELNRLTEGIEFRISDNGLGMPWDKRAEAFELFYRTAPARAAGLGVGLAVVKFLVEQSGGTLTVDSGEGQGTSFLVVLPRFDAGDYLSS